MRNIADIYAPFKPIIGTYQDNSNPYHEVLDTPGLGMKRIVCHSPLTMRPNYNDEADAIQRAQIRIRRHASSAVMHTLKQMPGFRPYSVIK
jgi:hypothetical protein